MFSVPLTCCYFCSLCFFIPHLTTTAFYILYCCLIPISIVRYNQQPSYNPNDFKGSCSHVTSLALMNWVICKTTSVLQTVRWQLQKHGLSAMASATLEASSQITATLMLCSTINVDVELAWRRVFRWISILFTISWWSHSYLAISWEMHVVSVHSTSTYWSITWSDDIDRLRFGHLLFSFTALRTVPITFLLC